MTPFLNDNLKFVLRDKKVLLGITGSIAAFKACDIVRFLRGCGAQVRVVLTEGAQNFVAKTTLETLSGSQVLNGFWSSPENAQPHGTHHIDTARWADVILVAPATAHFIAKMAHGLADDLLSTEILAFQGPLLVAPAMNPAMFANPAVQHNVKLLVERGTRILGPTEGLTSCGEEGLGRMLEPDQIVENTASVFHKPSLHKHLVITLGPTRSPIDPVRFITNRSSGLMGASLCWAALQAGYRVTAICGPTDATLPTGIDVIRVQTAQEMADASLRVWTDPKSRPDVFVAAAAVLDWDIKNPASTKLKKESGPPKLELLKNPDILAMISRKKSAGQFVLGFAAETESPVPNALEKLKNKGCDAIFANDVSTSHRGFESEFNGGWWISSPTQVVPLETSTKAELARKLLSMIGN